MNYLILIKFIMYFMFFLYLFISMLILKLSMFISLKIKLKLEKMSPFECGFNPIYYKRMSFSIRFFLITIIFLIFDIEIALLMPMILSFKFSNLFMWMLTNIIFIFILMIGLIYEWNYGALNWI